MYSNKHLKARNATELGRRGTCLAFPVQLKEEREGRGSVGGRREREKEEGAGREAEDRTILKTTILTFEKNMPDPYLISYLKIN